VASPRLCLVWSGDRFALGTLIIMDKEKMDMERIGVKSKWVIVMGLLVSLMICWVPASLAEEAKTAQQIPDKTAGQGLSANLPF
jgi:hypothetical protein